MTPTTPNAAWYSEGISWIASLFESASNDRVALTHSSDVYRPAYLEPEESLFDVRHRIQTRF